jgi:hypothetical protein
LIRIDNQDNDPINIHPEKSSKSCLNVFYYELEQWQLSFHSIGVPEWAMGYDLRPGGAGAEAPPRSEDSV